MRTDAIAGTNKRTSALRLVVALLAIVGFALMAGGCAGSASLHGQHGGRLADGGTADEQYQRVMRLAASAEAAGGVPAAAELYQNAHTLSPSRAEALVALGNLAAGAGDAGAAASYFRMATAVAPEDPAAWRGLGAALLAADSPEAAAEPFRAAIRLDPGDAASYSGLGITLDLRGAHDQARQVYESGLGKAPDSVALANNLALSLMLSRQFEPAIGMLQSIAGRGGAGPRIRQNLALAYALAGRMEDAASIAAVDLPSQEAQNNLAFYEALQGLSGPALASAVFHANIGGAAATPPAAQLAAADAGPATAEAPVDDGFAGHVTTATATPLLTPVDAPAVAETRLAAVECLMPDQLDAELIDPQHMHAGQTDDGQMDVEFPVDRTASGRLALAEPMQALRAAVRGYRMAWGGAAEPLTFDLVSVSPVSAGDGPVSADIAPVAVAASAPVPTGMAAAAEAASVEAAAVEAAAQDAADTAVAELQVKATTEILAEKPTETLADTPPDTLAETLAGTADTAHVPAPAPAPAPGVAEADEPRLAAAAGTPADTVGAGTLAEPAPEIADSGVGTPGGPDANGTATATGSETAAASPLPIAHAAAARILQPPAYPPVLPAAAPMAAIRVKEVPPFLQYFP